MIAYIHGGVDCNQEETNPQFITAFEQIGIGAHHEGKCFAMAKLIIAPLFKPGKDRVKAQLRVLFNNTKDGDVACVANLLG